MKRDLWIPLLIAAATIIIFWWVARSLSSVLVFIPGVIISFVFYLKTAYKQMPNPDRVLPWYLWALGIQFLHFTEEYLTDFTVVVPALLDQEPYPLDYWIMFNMFAYAVFVWGAIVIFKKLRAFMIIPLFYILVGVVLNSIGHVLIALYVGGYFSGLYTAIVYLIIGPVILKRISVG